MPLLDNAAFSQRIVKLRKSKGLTQERLGQLLGVTAQAVSKWERAETLPDLTLLPALCQILEVSADHLLAISTPVPKETKLSELKGTISPLNYEQRFLWMEQIWREMIHVFFNKGELREWNTGALYSGSFGYSLKGFSVMLSSEHIQKAVRVKVEDVLHILQVLADETHLRLISALDPVEHRTRQQLQEATDLSADQVALALLNLGQEEWLEVSPDGFRLSRKKGVLLLTILAAIYEATPRPNPQPKGWVGSISHPNMKPYSRQAQANKDSKKVGVQA